MACDPNTLLNDARCFNCLTEDQRAIINLSLLCTIAGNVGPPVIPLNPVAVTWGTNVVANGGAAPSAATILALSDFLYALDAAGLTSKMIAVNCLVPDSLIACITPLIVGPGFNPWTNNGFLVANLTVNGLIGNGAKTLNSGVSTGAFDSDADCGLTIYNLTAINENVREAGSNTDNVLLHMSIAGSLNYQCWSGGDVLTASNSLWTGYLSVNRHGVNTQVAYRAKSTVPHEVLGTRNSLVTARVNNSNTISFFGSPGFPCNKRLSFSAVHHGLTTAESSAFFNCIQSMRTALGGGFL